MKPMLRSLGGVDSVAETEFAVAKTEVCFTEVVDLDNKVLVVWPTRDQVVTVLPVVGRLRSDPDARVSLSGILRQQ